MDWSVVRPLGTSRAYSPGGTSKTESICRLAAQQRVFVERELACLKAAHAGRLLRDLTIGIREQRAPWIDQHRGIARVGDVVLDQHQALAFFGRDALPVGQ